MSDGSIPVEVPPEVRSWVVHVMSTFGEDVIDDGSWVFTVRGFHDCIAYGASKAAARASGYDTLTDKAITLLGKGKGLPSDEEIKEMAKNNKFYLDKYRTKAIAHA